MNRDLRHGVFRWGEEAATSSESESVHELLRLEFESTTYPSSVEILALWPEIADQETALFRSLDRALLEALEEAEDVGYSEDWDRIGFDVPSVASHPQNEHHSGFYPITRTLADLWHRIGARDRERARALGLAWADSRFLLIKRLSLFTLAHDVFTPHGIHSSK